MGALGSTPVLSPFDFFKGWQLSQARDMLLAYRSRDFDFGIDASVVTSLIGGDTQMADNIVKAFSPTSGVVNALSFLSAVILLSNDLESPNPTKSKSDIIFDTFDFQESGDMSLDEITILLLSVCRACNVVTGGGADPSDETMEQFALVMYQSANKKITRFISRKEFGSWIAEWVGTDNVDFAYLMSRFAPSALITPEQQAAFEMQAKMDVEKAEEEEKMRREMELKKRLEIEENARKEAEEKIRVEREKVAAEKAADEAKIEAERKVEETRLAEIRRVEEEARKVEEEKKRVEEGRIAEEARKVEEARRVEEAKLKEEEEAKLKAESDAAATKLQNLKRAKDARENVQARRESLAKLEAEAKQLDDEAKEKDAPPTLTEALLVVASGEDADAAATKLQSVQRANLAKQKVEDKRKELENLQEEAKAAGGGLDGSLKGLLDDAAEVEEDDEQSKIRAAQAKRERTHTVEHHSAPEAMKALEAAGKPSVLKTILDEKAEGGDGGIQSTPSVDEAKIRATQAARGTVEHHSAPEALKALEAAGKLGRWDGEGVEGEGGEAPRIGAAPSVDEANIKAVQAARGRTHTVEHSSAPEAMKALEAAGKLGRGEGEGEGEGGGEGEGEKEEEMEEEDAEEALEKELMKELELGDGGEEKEVEEKKEVKAEA